jgi:hypothetical protein
MANYVYLNNIAFNRMLRDDEWEALDAGQEYEAKNTLPLFWLCMFSEHDMSMTQADVDQEGNPIEPYPYLLAEQSVVNRNLAQRRSVVACLNPVHLSLYDSFCSRISTTTHPYWLLRTREIVGMSDAETFAQELVRTFHGFEEYLIALKNNDAASLRDHWFAAYLSQVKQNHSSYMLAGASTDSSWLPNEVEAQIPKEAHQEADKQETDKEKTGKKWWQFWK